MNKKYQIFISSTYEDLIDIRREVARHVTSLTGIPAAMEDFGAIDQNALEYIKSVIDLCDYYVLIVAGRYGSTDESGISYTEQEYDYAVEKKKTVLVFIRDDIQSLPAKFVETDTATRLKLDKFRKKIAAGRLVKFWKEPETLYPNIVASLGKAFQTHPGVGWIRADSINEIQTIENRKLEFENQKLRLEIEELRQNYISDPIDIEQLREMFLIGFSIFPGKILHSISLSWIEVYKIYAPLTERYRSRNRIQERLSDIFCHELRLKLNSYDLIEIDISSH